MGRVGLAWLCLGCAGCFFDSTVGGIGPDDAEPASTGGASTGLASATEPGAVPDPTTGTAATVSSDTTSAPAVTDAGETTDGSSSSGIGAEETAAVCEQLDSEPNDEMVGASTLTAHGCDGPEGETAEVQLSGTLADADDEDWYAGPFEWACVPGEPELQATVDVPATVCVFAACMAMGAVTTICEVGEPSDLFPVGMPGCCGDQTVRMDVNCIGSDESFLGWISVAANEDDTCVPYELTYDTHI